MAKRKPQKFYARWHRRSGIISAFFVLLLAVSGIFLNHSQQFGLDRIFVSSPVILKFYGAGVSDVSSVQVDGRWLSKAGGFIYFDDQRLDTCSGRFAGAVQLEEYWVAACGNELLLYTYEQQLVEKLGAESPLPFPVERIGTCQAELCVASGGKVYQLDLNQLSQREFDGEEGHSLLWSSPVEPPEQIKVKLAGASPTDRVSWQTLLLDIHAGRFMGGIGPYVLDVVAFLFIVFSITGIYMWFKGQRIHGARANRSD